MQGWSQIGQTWHLKKDKGLLPPIQSKFKMVALIEFGTNFAQLNKNLIHQITCQKVWNKSCFEIHTWNFTCNTNSLFPIFMILPISKIKLSWIVLNWPEFDSNSTLSTIGQTRKEIFVKFILAFLGNMNFKVEKI